MIHTPRLLPDEWSFGYWGRVLLLNGLSGDSSAHSKQRFMSEFAASQGIKFKGDDRALGVIGAAAGISLEQLVLRHTLVPFLGAVSGVRNGGWFDDRHQVNKLRLETVRDRFRLGALCTQCADEDIAFWGFSYWRRSHQIADVGWCQKHMCLLRHSADRMIAQPLPHLAPLQPMTSVHEERIRSAIENPVAGRYAEVCAEFLQRAKPISRLKMHQALAKQARLVGHGRRGDEIASSIYDLAARQLPGRWLDSLVGDGTSLKSVFARFYSGTRPSDYALAIALLYPSADAAFREIERPLPVVDAMLETIDQIADWRAPNAYPLGQADVLDRRRRLRSAIQGIFAGEEVNVACRRTASTPALIEAAIVACLTTPDADVVLSTNASTL